MDDEMNNQVRMVAGGVARVGPQLGQRPGASMVIRWFIPLRVPNIQYPISKKTKTVSTKGGLFAFLFAVRLHLANTAAGLVSCACVGAGMVAGPEAVRSHTVVDVCLVCSDSDSGGRRTMH